MDMPLFTSFEGRINRQKWWLNSIALLIVMFVVYLIVMPRLGIPVMSAQAITSEALHKLAIGHVVLTTIFAYPISALMKKRLNDRDRAAWYMYVFWAPTVISLLLAITGTAYTIVDVAGVMTPIPNPLMWIVSLAGFVIGIWALIELGFLRGTDGPNQHGPDPLAV